MKAMKCELCGSNELIKKDGLYECQYCKTKYTTEEAKKLLVEITGEVTVKNIGDTRSYLQLAKSAYESKNYKETEQYCNKVLEIDINNYEVWLMKGTSVGWQSTVVAPRTLESVKCFENAISYSPDNKKEEVTTLAISEMKKLLESLGNLACSFYKDSPTDYNATTIIETIPKILNDIGQFCSIVKTDFDDVISKIGINIDKTVMNTYQHKILPEYRGKDNRPSKYQFEEFVKLTRISVLLDDCAIACIVGNGDADNAAKVQIYKNQIEILMARGKACSYTPNYMKECVLSNEAKKENEKMIDERRQKIKELAPNDPLNREVEKKDIGWWIFFAFMTVGTLGGMSTNPIGTTFLFGLIMLISFPPFMNKMKKYGISLDTKIRILIVFVLFFVATIITGSSVPR